MTKKGTPLESLSSVLDRSLKRLDLVARLDDYAVWPIWNDVVGKVIARNAQPEKIRNGTLIVKVSSPVWMQQLQFMKDMITAKLNYRLKSDIVKNVFFVVGHIEMNEESVEPPPGDASENAECRIDDGFLQSIGDPQVRAAFKKLVQSYSRRKPKI